MGDWFSQEIASGWIQCFDTWLFRPTRKRQIKTERKEILYMTETLVKKILEAVQKADNYEPITIHHYGNDYIVIFRQESDGVKL